MVIEEKVVDYLIQKGYHIAFAESCTGGLASARIVNVPNASKVLNSSFVTYSNEAKMKFLGVKRESLEKYGAVSEQVAKEMACGVSKVADAEIGIGISGIAGPSGGTKEKPVGMVCFGIKVNQTCYTYTQYFLNKSRNEVRKESVDFVLTKLLELII
ncbi:CinA family protein [Calidifontibacillus erzurumensis]|uniref:CinA family protein n=1 Tax=Calidifontibacillus erzurumensis TaxID=2741433 RepID=A0A8J8GG03_9BACI|nr:CinA family protein [Calidifontibacillus erzurumensis]NSL53235.1 CinA family protein [Calidifontibacillus erzurumensis]